MNKTYLILLVLGLITTAVSVYQALSGKPFADYWDGLVLGIILTGAAYFQKENDQKET
ncbi:hypothetical protein [Phaeodactylibacter luteus]|uniref:hypothetical protein n=1 Tax=Phaeodactylibacter luteus TaxID=1564516 RepID=UPI001479368C|nr:hypothetical protein [Phaeodactylibacter luteus]